MPAVPAEKQPVSIMSCSWPSAVAQPESANVVSPASRSDSHSGSFTNTVFPAMVETLFAFTGYEAPPHAMGVMPSAEIEEQRSSSSSKVAGSSRPCCVKMSLL